VPADISTSINVTLSPTSIKVNESINVFAVVNPANAGSVTIEQSEDGIVWIPIGSGVATGTIISQFTPTEAGTYFVRARCTEYLDSAANKKYLASESSPVTLEVAKGFNVVLYVVVPVVVIAVGIVGFWLSKRITVKRT
jgi:butyrate kinase